MYINFAQKKKRYINFVPKNWSSKNKGLVHTQKKIHIMIICLLVQLMCNTFKFKYPCDVHMSSGKIRILIWIVYVLETDCINIYSSAL